MIGSPAERAHAEPVLAAIDPARRIDLMSNTPLLTAAACLQRCALYIGNDGGQMHLSAAAGVPTLGLFGPTPAHHYRPWGKLSDYVQAPEPFEGLEARIPEAMNAGDHPDGRHHRRCGRGRRPAAMAEGCIRRHTSHWRARSPLC